jgi:hypothetical protein
VDTPVSLKQTVSVILPTAPAAATVLPHAAAVVTKPKKLVTAAVPHDAFEKRLFEVMQEVSELRAENQDLCKRIRLLEERVPETQEPVVGSNLDAMTCLEAFLFH